MKTLILIVIIYLFSSIVSAQDTNDTVILIWHKKNLNTLQLQEFDSLRNFIFNTYEDVVYFRQVCPNYPDGENYYHLRCGENRLSIMSQLSSKSNILDSIQFDKAVNNSEMGCVNPINVNDPLMINYYVSEMLDLPCAWYITIGSLNVNVALIDYNFYYNSSTVHPEIENKIENHYDLGDFGNCPNYRAPVDPDPSPPQYHGLQMTGIIAAECNNEIGICGAAYATKLNLYEININSDFFYSEIESAICFAVENQEKIVNISLPTAPAGPENDREGFHEWIVNNDITIIYSAGNTILDIVHNHSYLYGEIEHIPGVIIVSSVNENNETVHDHTVTSYVTVCAPGYNIITTDWDTNIFQNTYKTGNGTSASAAFVSSAIALMLSVDSTLTPAQLEEILLTTTDSISDFEAANNYTQTVFGQDYTAGRLNTYHAVYKALNYNDCEASEIGIGQQLTWHTPKYICGDLIINGTLTLKAPMHILANVSEITINDGGKLIVDNYGELILWEDEDYNGKIIVNSGGILEIKNGGILTLSDYGSVSIEHNSSGNGELIFNQGAIIELLDDNTTLDIAGDLHIANNATFTFSGNGYIKFSKPGPDSAPDNIFAGTNASFVLEGTGKNDKKMEIQQSSVHFPALAELRFENCKIEMGASARMQTSLTSPITFENVKITSTTGVYNAHRSFHFYGQPNVTINNCIFENGYHGLYGNLTYGGAPLYISNSTFQNNARGIYIYNKGLNLDNCTVKNNTDYGIYCQSMSFNSNFTNCTISNNKYGMYYQGSASADVNISNTYIQSNTYDGIRTSGAFDLNMVCAFINNNGCGIHTYNGTLVRPYTCDISNNLTTIHLNYGRVYILNKYNQLQALNNGFTIVGNTPSFCGGGSPTILATHNRWESNPDAQPAYGSNYELYISNCYPLTPVILEDLTPAYLSCIQFKPFLLDVGNNSTANGVNETTVFESELPLVNVSGNLKPLDEAVIFLVNQIENLNSESSYLSIISQYSDLILSCNSWTGAEISYWQNIAYIDAHKLISDFYKFVDYDKTNVNFNAGVEELISINTSLLENASIPYTSFIEYSLDIALLNRMREHYTVSISQLEALTNELQFAGSESEYDYVQNWLCHIKAEKLAAEGMLTPDEFEFAIENCDLCFSIRNVEASDTINNSDNNYEKAKNDENDIINGNTENNFTISPNPNQGSFNIEFANSCLGCEIRIINSIGQLVKSVVADSDEKTIKIDGLTTGHYKIICLMNNEVVDTGTIVVK